MNHPIDSPHPPYTTIAIDLPRPGVGRITFNRPAQLDALNSGLQGEVLCAAKPFDADPAIGAIVLTGSRKAFAAGGDIAEMAELSFADVESNDLFAGWDELAQMNTPLIAAVSGYALGGGAEVAMLCDIVIADTTATFGQPEVKLGTLPGFGGTQRLTRAIGKAKTMDLCLTARTMGRRS